jgi:hypothetical protein
LGCWAREQLQSVSIWAVSAIIFAICLALFAIPPVPGRAECQPARTLARTQDVRAGLEVSRRAVLPGGGRDHRCAGLGRRMVLRSHHDLGGQLPTSHPDVCLQRRGAVMMECGNGGGVGVSDFCGSGDKAGGVPDAAEALRRAARQLPLGLAPPTPRSTPPLSFTLLRSPPPSSTPQTKPSASPTTSAAQCVCVCVGVVCLRACVCACARGNVRS